MPFSFSGKIHREINNQRREESFKSSDQKSRVTLSSKAIKGNKRGLREYESCMRKKLYRDITS